jgi:hypothetical protein
MAGPPSPMEPIPFEWRTISTWCWCGPYLAGRNRLLRMRPSEEMVSHADDRPDVRAWLG